MQPDIYAVQLHDCICRRVIEIREYADAICEKDFTLKYCLEVYKHLTALRAGLDFSLQCNEVVATQDGVVFSTLEEVGVSYEAYSKSRQAALAELQEKASTPKGREELFHATNDLMDFFDDQKMVLHQIVHLQSQIARTAFQIERQRNGAEDPCVEAFIKRREMEYLGGDATLEFADVSAGCE